MQTTFDPNDPAFTRALERLRPELDLISAERVEAIRHDIDAAITTALGVIPNVMPYEAAARAELGDETAAAFAKLPEAARACGAANSQYRVTLHGTDLEEAVGILGEKRKVLLLEAESLVLRKHMPGTRLAELVGGQAYRACATDVLQLVAAFRKDWPAIETQTPVTMVELEQAEGLANFVITTLGENEQSVASSPGADLRRRAYTHLVAQYEEVRRAITYLRWEAGDADDICPSLSAGRTRRKDDVSVDLPPPAMPQPNGTVPAPGMPGAPAFGPLTS